MAPFEALYGRKCRIPLNWVEPGERRFYGIDFVIEAEKKVRIIRENMQAAQTREGDHWISKWVTMSI
jgi:helix-turn-helix protein